MGDSAVAERIGAFEERLARAQATEVVELGWGHCLLQADYPASWHHNRLVVTGAVDPAEVVTAADDLLGGAGHEHRLVQFHDDALGVAAAPAFRAAGYGQHERIVTMVHSGEPPAAGGRRADEIAFDRLRPFLLADWRADFPDDPDEHIEQLADRTLLYSRGAEVTLLAVCDDDGRVLGRGELYVRDGVAQFENLITHPDSRGTGCGRALVVEALRRSAAAGADLWFLIAEATGWPRAWYRRLGYRDTTQVHLFQRAPADAP